MLLITEEQFKSLLNEYAGTPELVSILTNLVMKKFEKETFFEDFIQGVIRGDKEKLSVVKNIDNYPHSVFITFTGVKVDVDVAAADQFFLTANTNIDSPNYINIIIKFQDKFSLSKNKEKLLKDIKSVVHHELMHYFQFFKRKALNYQENHKKIESLYLKTHNFLRRSDDIGWRKIGYILYYLDKLEQGAYVSQIINHGWKFYESRIKELMNFDWNEIYGFMLKQWRSEENIEEVFKELNGFYTKRFGKKLSDIKLFKGNTVKEILQNLELHIRKEARKIYNKILKYKYMTQNRQGLTEALKPSQYKFNSKFLINESQIEYLLEALRDELSPEQIKALSRLYTPEKLKYILNQDTPPKRLINNQDILPTGKWKLSEDDKIQVINTILNIDIKEYQKVLDVFSKDKRFIALLLKTIKESTEMNFKRSIKRIGNPLELLSFVLSNRNLQFNGLDVAAFKGTKTPQRDESGEIIRDENGKPLLVDVKGQLRFSDKPVDFAKFIEQYNAIFGKNYPTDWASSKTLENVKQASIRGGCTLDISYFNVNDLYLTILDQPSDILNMSLSKFFTSCQNIIDIKFSEKLRRQAIGNVFDDRLKVAYLVINEEAVYGDIRVPYTAMSRALLRMLDDGKVFVDRTYPGDSEGLRKVMTDIVQKYSGANTTTENPDRYDYTGIKGVDPYFDKLSAVEKRKKLLPQTGEFEDDECNNRNSYVQALGNFFNTSCAEIADSEVTNILEYRGETYQVLELSDTINRIESDSQSKASIVYEFNIDDKSKRYLKTYFMATKLLSDIGNSYNPSSFVLSHREVREWVDEIVKEIKKSKGYSPITDKDWFEIDEVEELNIDKNAVDKMINFFSFLAKEEDPSKIAAKFDGSFASFAIRLKKAKFAIPYEKYYDFFENLKKFSNGYYRQDEYEEIANYGQDYLDEIKRLALYLMKDKPRSADEIVRWFNINFKGLKYLNKDFRQQDLETNKDTKDDDYYVDVIPIIEQSEKLGLNNYFPQDITNFGNIIDSLIAGDDDNYVESMTKDINQWYQNLYTGAKSLLINWYKLLNEDIERVAPYFEGFVGVGKTETGISLYIFR